MSTQGTTTNNKNLKMLISGGFVSGYLLIMMLMFIFGFLACGESEEDNETASETTTATPSVPTSGSLVINTSVPKDVALTSVTAAPSEEALSAGGLIIKNTSLTNAADHSLLKQQSSEKKDYSTLIAKVKGTLTATEVKACAAAIPGEISLSQGNIGHSKCFGPRVTYTNHPDNGETSEFGSGDLGMFWDLAESDGSSNEACSTRVGNNLMSAVGSYANTAVGIQALVACAGRLGKADFPSTAGSSTDMTSYLSGSLDASSPVTITSAVITAESGHSSGKTFYTTTASGTLADVPRGLTKNFTLSVSHVPLNDENSAYKGAVQFVINEFEGTKDAAISLVYSWGEKKLQYRYRQVQVAAGTANNFDETTREVAIPSGNLPSGWMEVLTNVNELGIGKITFVWHTFDLLVFHSETKSDGSGVSYFGHTPNTVTPGSDEFYKIKSFRCYAKNPTPGGNSYGTSKVQKQTLALTSSGTWDADVSNLTFAPTVSCDWNGSSGTFTAYREQGGPGSEETLQLGAITNNLSDISDYESTWVNPTAPSF